MSLLITPEYLQQQKEMHARGNYGLWGHKWAETVWTLAHDYEIGSVLDFGAGACTLHKALQADEHIYRFKSRFCCQEHPWLTSWQDYDPAIEGLDAEPQPADAVICTDCLEHIEPDHLRAVLDEIQRCAKKVCFLVVATRPAKKTLPDGRNAHLIQQPVNWWLSQLLWRFHVRDLQNRGGEFIFIGEAA